MSVLVLLHLINPALATTNTPHVCVVGAGISGATIAHFLSFEPSPRVTVFEKDDHVGGRVQTLHIPGVKPIEAGASIIADANQLMAYFVEYLNLTRTRPHSIALRLWNGKSVVFEEHPYSAITALSALLRYGRSIFIARKQTNALLERYARLYPSTGAGGVWLGHPTVRSLLGNVGLYNLTQQRFDTDRFSSRYRDEIVSAIVRVNYGQEPEDMNALAGSVSLAGSGDALWAVEGGNHQVIEGLLRESVARVELNTNVRGVRHLPDEKAYELDNSDGEVIAKCDAVVLAAPTELAEVVLPGTSSCSDIGREFQLTVTTFVKGSVLNRTTFGLDEAPKSVLTTARTDDVFTLVNEVAPGIYKIFSRKALDDAAIDRLFEDKEKAHIIAAYNWLAYPKFKTCEKFADFVLDEGGLFYTSPLESAGSAMEMSAVASANVAHLVRNHLGLQRTVKQTSEGKDEL